MRVCPTHAIRVKDAKAHYRPDSCIDCGICLRACSRDAICATTTPVEDLSRFKFKVAVPSPVLFGQFPTGITPAQVVDGLLAFGFDEVWDYSVEINLVARAIQQYVEQWTGPTPLISVSCPVVVRLVQVSYPAMVNQLIPVQPAREIAGREAKRRFSARLGLREDQIAVIYITPCQAKTISILQPAEGVVSNLDGALGFPEVYNAVLACRSLKKGDAIKSSRPPIIRNSGLLRLHVSEGMGRLVQQHRYLSGDRPVQHNSGLQRHRKGEATKRGLPRGVQLLERLRWREPHRREHVCHGVHVAFSGEDPAGDGPCDGSGSRTAVS